MGFLVLWMCIL